ncbi:testis-expressed protein 35 [Tachyglossus aculeatus]|uniref:testis-expressed protein 35 n=1 Tax=Tachyglossus aculeatus TaxID=9261 RepID=UPI0018F3CD9A|nr:testis-expressed protein 35 [Tachyglossus aculeatus]
MTRKGELRKPTPIKNFRAVHRETETQLVRICENNDGKEELLLEKTEDTHDLKSELKEVREELKEKLVEIKQVKQNLDKEFCKLQQFMDILKEMQKNMDEKMETLLNMQKTANLTQAEQAINKEVSLDKVVPETNYENRLMCAHRNLCRHWKPTQLGTGLLIVMATWGCLLLYLYFNPNAIKDALPTICSRRTYQQLRFILSPLLELHTEGLLPS